MAGVEAQLLPLTAGDVEAAAATTLEQQKINRTTKTEMEEAERASSATRKVIFLVTVQSHRTAVARVTTAMVKIKCVSNATKKITCQGIVRMFLYGKAVVSNAAKKVICREIAIILKLEVT